MHMKVGHSQGPCKLFSANLHGENEDVEKKHRMIQHAKDLLVKESQ